MNPSLWVHTRSLAGKPLAGFRATPSRRIPVLYGMVVYVIRFNNQLLHRQPTVKKTTAWGESGFPSEFLGPVLASALTRCGFLVGVGTWRRYQRHSVGASLAVLLTVRGPNGPRFSRFQRSDAGGSIRGSRSGKIPPFHGSPSRHRTPGRVKSWHNPKYKGGALHQYRPSFSLSLLLSKSLPCPPDLSQMTSQALRSGCTPDLLISKGRTAYSSLLCPRDHAFNSGIGSG